MIAEMEYAEFRFLDFCMNQDLGAYQDFGA